MAAAEGTSAAIVAVSASEGRRDATATVEVGGKKTEERAKKL